MSIVSVIDKMQMPSTVQYSTVLVLSSQKQRNQQCSWGSSVESSGEVHGKSWPGGNGDWVGGLPVPGFMGQAHGRPTQGNQRAGPP
jgi:hypothetical protein